MNDVNPYTAPSPASEPPNIPSRNLAVELIGTVLSMIAGAFVGLMIPGNGLGWVSFVVLCSFLGWVVWTRRKQSFLATIGICFLIVVAWWPIGLAIRDLGHAL